MVRLDIVSTRVSLAEIERLDWIPLAMKMPSRFLIMRREGKLAMMEKERFDASSLPSQIDGE
jgi:hypothetical protein